MTKLGVRGFAIQFNWIFIMVAGALIIAFFVFLIQGQKENTETKIDVDTAIQLDSIFTSAQQSAGTSFSIKSPSFDLGFDSCAEDTRGVFTIGSVGVIRKEGAFAPSEIKSAENKLLVAAHSFNVPFRAMNLLYVTSPDIKYVFIDDFPNTVASSFLASDKVTMPNGTTVILSEDCKIADTNNYKIRYVFFDSIASYSGCFDNIQDMSDSDITTVVFTTIDDSIITDVTQLNGPGKVQFFVKDGNNFQSQELNPTYFLGVESALGAILSETQAGYECSMKQAFANLNRIASMQKERLDELTLNFVGQSCGTIYQSLISEYSGENALIEIGENSAILSNKLGVNEITQISTNSRAVANFNKALQLQSCPLIY